MIHPIIWALVEAHPFWSYFIVALIVGSGWAYGEGKWSDEKELTGFVFPIAVLWPLSLAILSFAGLCGLAIKLFEAGRKNKD